MESIFIVIFAVFELISISDKRISEYYFRLDWKTVIIVLQNSPVFLPEQSRDKPHAEDSARERMFSATKA